MLLISKGGVRSMEKRAPVNMTKVIQILSSKVSLLTTENAMLQARVMDLENELQKLKAPPEKKKTESAEMKKAVKPNKEDVVNGT